MQTILGAGGAIGVALAKSISEYTHAIRLVSRNPKAINPNDTCVPTDLKSPEAIDKAIKGSEVVYVTIGFQYKTKVWEDVWPPFIAKVIESCKKYGVKLVFFDNVYALDPADLANITEEAALKPCSKKGKVRAKVDRLLLEAMEMGKLNTIIARSPDFFGPIMDKSVLMTTVYQNLIKGKKAQWFCNSSKIHSVGYTPELAMGMATLGNDPTAYNAIWNLPVSQEKVTGSQWMSAFASALQVNDKQQVIPRWGLKLLGIVVPIMGELEEMSYQYQSDYFFNAGKYIANYNYEPLSYTTAIAKTLESLQPL